MIIKLILPFFLIQFAGCHNDNIAHTSIGRTRISSSEQSVPDLAAPTSVDASTSSALGMSATSAKDFGKDASSAQYQTAYLGQSTLNKQSSISELNNIHKPFGKIENVSMDRNHYPKIKPTAAYRMNANELIQPAPSKREQRAGLPPIISMAPEQNQERQNSNPNIQDIITGIVKLLNGNVNVHANTQGLRKPSASRINNRGPPKISEMQTLPLDYEAHKHSLVTSNRPFLYPFDRLERPFLTGVPIPEQIVPYRPGHLANKPPWGYNKQKPPMSSSSGGRRPIVEYKPMLQNKLENFEDTRVSEAPNNMHHEAEGAPESGDDLTDAVNQFSNITHQHMDNANDQHGTADSEEIGSHFHTSILREDEENRTTNSLQHATKKYTTIIQTSSVIHAVVDSSTLPIQFTPDYDDANSGGEEIIFMTASKTMEANLGILQSSEPIITTISTTATPTLIPLNDTAPTTNEPATTTQKRPEVQSSPTMTTTTPYQYHSRPGIVLDDPEFKPEGRFPQLYPASKKPDFVQSTKQVALQGYGEIFDVTLTAIQGPGGSQHSFEKPVKGVANDIIVMPSGNENFVLIDGKRTYIDLWGEPTAIAPYASGNRSSSVEHKKSSTNFPRDQPHAETKAPKPTPTGNKPFDIGQHQRTRPTQSPVRIDTCIVGDDTTCDQAQYEMCRTEHGISSCHCRPGYSRRKHREPCRKILAFYMGMRVDRIYEHPIVWDRKLLLADSEPYKVLSYEAVRAMKSAMSMTPYSDEFIDVQVNNIYRGAELENPGVFLNLTLKFDESVESLRNNVQSDVQKQYLGVLHRRNNNIGNSILYVTSPQGSVTTLNDLDECFSAELNDCHENAICMNVCGSFRCQCKAGTRDPWVDQVNRAGRECMSCTDTFCNNRGTCAYNEDGTQVCNCKNSYYGSQCEIDGEVMGVAIGASLAAVIIIVSTLICLIMWSRRWQNEQKCAVRSPVFGLVNTGSIKSPGLAQPGYQVTLDDRMRWAQIADVVTQSNHYGTEPVGPTRPSSALFSYPNIQATNFGSIGGVSRLKKSMIPPLAMSSQGQNGMTLRTLECSSSSDDDNVDDLLVRNFDVSRPKSLSNASVANQSGIYYDVDYQPSVNHTASSNNFYASKNRTTVGGSHMYLSTPPGLPINTYTSRCSNTYYQE